MPNVKVKTPCVCVWEASLSQNPAYTYHIITEPCNLPHTIKPQTLGKAENQKSYQPQLWRSPPAP